MEFDFWFFFVTFYDLVDGGLRFAFSPSYTVPYGAIQRHTARPAKYIRHFIYKKDKSMPEYRRCYTPGSWYFFTVVTYKRQAIFDCEEVWNLLRKSLLIVKHSHPFRIGGFVLLPDHLHVLWKLPEGDSNFSVRWNLIKSGFTRLYKKWKPTVNQRSSSRIRKREQSIWQRRFWEHRIRNQDDYYNHMDYIHYNPVKHGYVSSPKDWKWSTFKKYVGMSLYTIDWGESMPDGLINQCMGE